MQNKLFKKSSVERFSSPEKLNDYIQVGNPSCWMVLCAALALVLGVLIWGFFGVVTDSLSFTGLAQDGTLRCYVSDSEARSLKEDMVVQVMPQAGGENAVSVRGSVISVAETPLSYAEAAEGVQSDYLLNALGLSTWNVEVQISVEEPLYDGMIYSVSVVTDTRRPIELVFQ